MRSPLRNLAACGFVFLFVSLVGVSSSFAKGTPYRKMRFLETKTELQVSVSFTDLFDYEAFEELQSGLPNTVVFRIYVYRKDRELPISVRVLSLRVVYDLWDEVFVVKRTDQNGEKILKLESKAEVLRYVARLSRYPIARLADVAIGPHHFLAVRAQLNPVDERRLAEMRRWLTRSTSQTKLDSSSSFFGSFVSVFANPKLEAADRELKFRSQPFYRVKKK